MSRAARLLQIGSAALWMAVAACGGDGGAPPAGPEEPDTTSAPDSIEIVPQQQFMGGLGVTRQIVAVALAADGSLLYSSAAFSDRFSWSSSAPDVVTVDDHGTITSVGWGTATVTTTTEGVAATTPVTVRDAVEVAWSVRIPGTIDAGNVMAADGTIYVGTSQFPVYRSLWYAIAPGGGVRWILDLPLTSPMVPAIGGDGTLYLGSEYRDTTGPGSRFSGSLIAVDPDGSVRWELLLDEEGVHSAPALGMDGTIYVAADSRVYAVDPEGEVRWSHEAADNVFFLSSPAVAADGTIYVGGEDGRLYAINPDGSLRWTFETGDRIRSSPSIGLDGTVYFGSHDGRLYAVRPDGSERWSVELHCGLPWGCLHVKASPSIGPDGSIYVMVDGVYALDPGGTIRWQYPVAGQSARNTAVVGADGTIYVANSHPVIDGKGKGTILALDPEGRLLWEHRTEDPAGGSPVIALDGTIIVTVSDQLVGIVEHESTNGGFDAAAWPQARGNRANNGRAGG